MKSICIIAVLYEIFRLMMVRLRITVGFSKQLIPMIHCLAKNVSKQIESNGASRVINEDSRILIVGQLVFGGTAYSRMKALKRIFNTVDTINICDFMETSSFFSDLLANHLYFGRSLDKLNQEIMNQCEKIRPDILWVDKGVHIYPETLVFAHNRGCQLLVHFSPDNQMIYGNQSRHYIRTLSLYDVHITTKTNNREWLLNCGVKAVEQMGKAFDPDIHRHMMLSDEDKSKYGCDIGFVGHWEPIREEIVLKLFVEKGYEIKVWGGGWERAKHKKHPLFSNATPLVGDEYAKAICGAKINLCLISDVMGDKTTARSIEIPACGKFMLAERNEEHLALFEEDKEVAFYEGWDELAQKIECYLCNDAKREVIANNGYHRCLKEYSNEMRLRKLLAQESWKNLGVCLDNGS